MAIWQVEFSKNAFKTYHKLAREYQKRVDRLLNLLIDKEKVDIKPIEGKKDYYRIRLGKYRILLKFITEKKTILIIKIGARGDVYKK